MSLDTVRSKLDRFLDEFGDEAVLWYWNVGFQNMLEDWWTAYKEMEAGDSFKDAFEQSRMTIRVYRCGQEERQARLTTRFNYNEIILAYRQHASSAFPMFAQWKQSQRTFEVITIGSANQVSPTGQIIADRPT